MWWTPPALRPPVLPGLPHLDEALGFRSGQVATDRLGRAAESGIVGVDDGAGHDGRRTPVAAHLAQGVLERVLDGKADRRLCLGHAPVQRNRRDLMRGELVLGEQVAYLRAVAVGQDHLVAGSHQPGHAGHSTGDGGLLGGHRGISTGADHRIAAERDQDAVALRGFVHADADCNAT